MKRLVVILLLMIPFTRLIGQNFSEASFDRYTTANGLSHNLVTCLKQDSTGYVWITTSAGLNRFNGTHFIQFHSERDSLSLPSEDLKGMSWLDKHRLAIFTSGLHIIDTRTGKTKNLFIPYKDKLYLYKFNMIEAVKSDSEGNLYVLSRSGFYQFDKDYKLVSRFDFYSDEEVSNTHFFFGREMYDLDDNRFVINSIDGFYIYDKAKKKIKKYEVTDCPAFKDFGDYPRVNYQFLPIKPGHFFVIKSTSDTIIYMDAINNKKVISHLPFKPEPNEFHYRTKLMQVNDTSFYLTSHTAGFFKIRFYPETGQIKMYPTRHFPSYLCNYLLRDKDDNLWVATTKGLLRQDPTRSQVQIAPLPPSMENTFPNIRLDDVYVSGDKIYAATKGLGGLLIFNKKTFQFEEQVLFHKYKTFGIERGNSITGIAAAGASSLLLGTDWPILLFDKKTHREKKLQPPVWGDGDWVSDFYTDRNKNIWISAYNIYLYNPSLNTFRTIPTHKRLPNVPFVIEEDTSGNIWMAAHGLARYNTKVDSFDVLLDSFPIIKMHDKQVNALAIDNQNTIWFNPNDNGLVGYDPAKKTYRQFTRSNGLPNDNVASLYVLGRKLWIATYSGIACMDLQSYQIVTLGKDDGFPEMPVQKGARFYYDSTDQFLYLAFSHAVVRFNPYSILRKKLPPRVFIENIVINGKENIFLPGNQVTTNWRDNEVMITIGSINFSDSRSERFAYRIVKDIHTPWQQLGSQTSFSISNLSPGTYRIQVKSFSQNNRWPEQVKEITIIVQPPFWKKSWFLLLWGVLFLALVYSLIKWRTSIARKKEMEKTHIEKLKADDYKNQFELEQISNYFSSSLANKKTEDEVLWDVASNLIGRMNYVDCMLYLWNEDKTKMVQKAAYGPKGRPELISGSIFDVLPGQGVVGHVVETCQPILIPDTRRDPRYRVDEEFRLSEIAVPIMHNGELLGVLDSEHYEPGYFKERDIKILTTIATLIGNKLKQIESEQSLEAKHQELAGINEQLAEARLAALQTQMNPHFVFNALNSIKRMILDADNEKASRYLSKFASMIRMTLNHSKDVFVTLEENIRYIKSYLEMEQLRFDDSFTYNVCIDDCIDPDEVLIPSLMIQPLVENAIWHGLMQVEGEKKMCIAFRLDQNQIKCIIEDNGIGIAQSERNKSANKSRHQSVGLENLHKRIKIINGKYDANSSLVITDLKDIDPKKRGTLVVLRLNIITA